MTRGVWLLVKGGGLPLTIGTAAKAAWWWSQIAYHERRIEGIAELAVLDDNQEMPPRDLWYSWARHDLDLWIEDRKKRKEDR